MESGTARLLGSY